MDLVVQWDAGAWMARLGDLALRCAIGRNGASLTKREGDGRTPVGRWLFRSVLFRPDFGPPPETRLCCRALRESDGWCDDPADPAYNRLITLPYAASHERLWRSDRLYDLIVCLGHNDDPPQPGLGSAIFLHQARPDWGPTDGCVALARADLLAILREVGPQDALVVIGEGAPDGGSD